MKRLFLLSCYLILILVTSCQQELAEDEWVYAGDWSSKTYALQIFRNGYGVCNSRKFGVPITYEGRVKITQDRIVFIDTEDKIRKRFKIDQSPAKDSTGTTYMILDGEQFTRH